MKFSTALVVAVVLGATLVADVDALSRRERAKARRLRNRERKRAKKAAQSRVSVPVQTAPVSSRADLNSGYGVLPANLRPEIQQQLLRHRAKLCFDSGTVSLAASNLRPTSCRATSLYEATCTLECASGETATPVPSICRDFNGLPVHSVFDTVTCRDGDGDGVLDAVENGAPNNGDGNNDGIPDSQQNNVVSFPDANTTDFVTLIAPEGISFIDVTTDPNTPTLTAFEGVGGVFAFSLTGVTPNGQVNVTAILTGPDCGTVTTIVKACPGDPFVPFPTTGAGTCTLTWELTDNLDGDCDDTLGVIRDPGIFAKPAPCSNMCSETEICVEVYSESSCGEVVASHCIVPGVQVSTEERTHPFGLNSSGTVGLLECLDDENEVCPQPDAGSDDLPMDYDTVHLQVSLVCNGSVMDMLPLPQPCASLETPNRRGIVSLFPTETCAAPQQFPDSTCTESGGYYIKAYCAETVCNDPEVVEGELVRDFPVPEGLSESFLVQIAPPTLFDSCCNETSCGSFPLDIPSRRRRFDAPPVFPSLDLTCVDSRCVVCEECPTCTGIFPLREDGASCCSDDDCAGYFVCSNNVCVDND